jgi:hypothetical protein
VLTAVTQELLRRGKELDILPTNESSENLLRIQHTVLFLPILSLVVVLELA